MKKIRFGCIGYGFMGKTHVANIMANPRASIEAIFTKPDNEIDLDGVKIFKDWRRLIEYEEVDAVIVATPTQTHKKITKYAANHGKHIFVEKPMARTILGAEEMIHAAQENGVKLFVGHVLRYFQAFSQAKMAITQDNNSIGEIKMVRGLRYSTLPNWSKWFFNEEKSGGCILDLSIHDIDYACWIIGKMPETVYCEARKLPEENINTWVMSMTNLEFENGEIAHLEASWLGNESFPWYTENEIIGTEGIIQFDSNSTIPLHQYSKEKTTPLDLFDKDGYYYELDSFIQSIWDNKPAEVSGEQGLKAVSVCIAAIKSAEEGRPISMREVLRW